MKGNKLGRPPLESAKRRENKILARVDDFVHAEFAKEAEKHGVQPATLAAMVIKKFVTDPSFIFTA